MMSFGQGRFSRGTVPPQQLFLGAVGAIDMFRPCFCLPLGMWYTARSARTAGIARTAHLPPKLSVPLPVSIPVSIQILPSASPGTRILQVVPPISAMQQPSLTFAAAGVLVESFLCGLVLAGAFIESQDATDTYFETGGTLVAVLEGREMRLESHSASNTVTYTSLTGPGTKHQLLIRFQLFTSNNSHQPQSQLSHTRTTVT